MKEYNEQQNIGKSRYIVNYHNGESKHKDGSKFFNIALFTNKKDKDKFINSLIDYTRT